MNDLPTQYCDAQKRDTPHHSEDLFNHSELCRTAVAVLFRILDESRVTRVRKPTSGIVTCFQGVAVRRVEAVGVEGIQINLLF